MDKTTEVKLQLKKQIIGHDGKPVKDDAELKSIMIKNPQLSLYECLSRCSDITIGKVLPNMLLTIPTQDATEKLKLFRWAEKIQDKMITNKGEITLDLIQVTELYEFVLKSQGTSINVFVPVTEELKKLKEKLSSK